MKRITQVSIITFGAAASAYGISKMTAEIKTMIIPAWLIILVISLVVGAVSMGIGVLAKRLLKSKWHSLSFASIIIMTVVGVYSISEYKPTLKILVPADYAGKVKLFVSNDTIERREINVNNFGIGYITRKDLEGFYPKIIKGKRNITKEIKEYSKGTILDSRWGAYTFEYLSFDIPGESNPLNNDIVELVRIGAIDTMRLPTTSTQSGQYR